MKLPIIDSDFVIMISYLVVNCGSVPPAGSHSSLVNSTGTIYQSTVTYVCNTGYTTAASMTLTCLSTGQWSGNNGPDCTG